MEEKRKNMRKSFFVFALFFGISILSTCVKDPASPQLGGPTTTMEVRDSTEFVQRSASQSYIRTRLAFLLQRQAAAVGPSVVAALDTFVQRQTLTKRSADTASEATMLMMAGIEAIFRGSMSTALYCFLRAAAIEPDNATILSKIGYALNYRTEYAEALEILLRARELDTTFHEIRAGLANSYAGLGDNDRAIFEMLTALSSFPSNIRYLIRLSELYIADSNQVAAVAALGRAKIMAPLVPEITTALQEIIDHPIPPPQPETPEPPPLIDPSQIVMIIDSVFSAYSAAVNRHTPEISRLVSYGGVETQLDNEFQNRTYESEQLCNACMGPCCPSEASEAACDACLASCFGLQCQRDQRIWSEISMREKLEVAIPLEREYRLIQSEFLAEAYGYVYRHPSAVDLVYAVNAIDSFELSLQSTIESVPIDAKNLIIVWANSVASTCQQAAEAEQIAAQSLLDEQNEAANAPDISFCLVMCVTINNGQVSLEASLAFASVGLSYDMQKGFGVSMGVTALGFATTSLEVQQNGSVSVKYGVQTPMAGPQMKIEQSISLN